LANKNRRNTGRAGGNLFADEFSTWPKE